MPKTLDMTAHSVLARDWINHPFGKTLRVLIAAGGLITATLVVMLSTLGSNSVWFLLLLGLFLGTAAVRAALHPTTLRLSIVFAAMVAIPITGLLI